ncbi:MAG: TolC family protein [bacterium]
MQKFIIILIIFFTSSIFAETLNLENCINLALEKNSEITILKNNYEISKSKIKESKSNYFPRIIGNFSILKQETFFETLDESSVVNSSMDKTNCNISFSLKQNIWDFGKTFSVVNQALLNENLSLLQLEKKKESIYFEVKKCYFILLQAKAINQIANTNLKSLENLLNSIKAKKEQGLATSLDVLQLELEYTKLKAEINKTNYQIELAKMSLSNFINKNDFEIEEKKIILDELEFKNFEECKEKALLNRIEFKKLILQENIYKTKIVSIRSEYFPNIGGSFSYGFQNNKFDFPFKKNWSCGLNISIPLFDGFFTREKLFSAKQELKNVVSEKEQLIQNISLQIKKNYYKVLEEKGNFEVVQKKLEYSNANLESIKAKYKEELATFTELIDGQTKKINCDIEYQQFFYSYQIALNELYQSIGVIK